MATFVEFENSQGRKFLVNPEYVSSVSQTNKDTDPTVITVINGPPINVKETVDQVQQKLRGY